MAVPLRLGLYIRHLCKPINLSYCNARLFHKRAKEYSGVRVFRHLNKEISADASTDDELVDFNPFGPVTANNKVFLDSLVPAARRSFNLAAYVDQSNTLQNLIKLGVSLYDIENSNIAAAKFILNLDFEQDCLPYIRFLIDNGLKEKNIGRFISEYPFIFQTPLDDLQARINYLESKAFTKPMIAKALNRSTHILYHKTKTLDHKLGKLQVEFCLPAEVLRSIVVKYPPVVSIPHAQYILVYFALREEFGFDLEQMYKILESQPKIIEMPRPDIISRLDFVHNKLGLSHELITQFPKLFTAPESDVRDRGNYLKKLKRDQYDPQKPLYVIPSYLYNSSDEEFCEKCAKTSLEDFYLFLKYS